MPSATDAPTPAFDPGHCPLCGAANACAMAATATAPASGAPQDCWCQVSTIAPGVLERLPAALRGQACICARCARG